MENQENQHSGIETQTPFMKILNIELKAALEKAILDLPEKYRTVFIMREIENMNVAETKECLDISEANVKVRLNRAKTLLKNSLSEYYKKEDIIKFSSYPLRQNGWISNESDLAQISLHLILILLCNRFSFCSEVFIF
jgi:RNA polymerase sigma-70 factor (ECF subfamily)